MAKLIQQGAQLDYTAGADIALGDVVVFGNNAHGVACAAIANGAKGAISMGGVFEMAKAAVAITAGALLYWNADDKEVQTTPITNRYIGRAAAAAADSAATVPVILNAPTAATIAVPEAQAAPAVTQAAIVALTAADPTVDAADPTITAVDPAEITAANPAAITAANPAEATAAVGDSDNTEILVDVAAIRAEVVKLVTDLTATRAELVKSIADVAAIRTQLVSAIADLATLRDSDKAIIDDVQAIEVSTEAGIDDLETLKTAANAAKTDLAALNAKLVLAGIISA